MFNIVKYNKIFLGLSVLLVLISATALIAWGLKPNIDFTGGSLVEISFSGPRPDSKDIASVLKDNGFADAKVQPLGDTSIVIKTKELSADDHAKLIDDIKKTYEKDQNKIEERRFDSIGSVIGSETKRNAYLSIILVLIGIVIYIAYAFRKVSKPISSFVYGFAAIIALVHDVTITAGIFSFLGHFKGVEIDSLFITALLTVLGFSVHDTIVVFDRVRENLLRDKHSSFKDIINTSINETLVRSINTSSTALFVLLSMFFFGGTTIQYFVLALVIGIIVGTYSSIFIASPLLILWDKYRSR